MAWYDEAIFYHIYPLGLCGAPAENHYDGITHTLPKLIPWIDHIRSIGCNAIYIGPLFESGSHGYDTTDYKKLDSRLGDNDDLKTFVKKCHESGLKVIFDGVFNHTGRDFFAFRDLKEKRESSPYRDWYCNVNFYGNNEYNDGFSYDNWGGYNLLVKLNQRNPAVRDYICDVIRFWVSEFDVDGLRLDAADVLDFDFMKALRATANQVKPDFWLMGEVIHGDYTRWVNEGTLHSVTNYNLHKALYSGHNDHNYFEIAHTVKRLYEMGGNRVGGLKLYNFVDNHDVERIQTKLTNKAHFAPVHVLLYTLPGIPSIYYGSEFAIEGRKEAFSDASLRPCLNLSDYQNALTENPATRLIAGLGKARQQTPALSYGEYRELALTNRQYAFSRKSDNDYALITVNNDDGGYTFSLPAEGHASFRGLLTGASVSASNGQLSVQIPGNSGEIWVPAEGSSEKEGSWSEASVNPAAGAQAPASPEPSGEQTIDSWTEVDSVPPAASVVSSWVEVGESADSASTASPVPAAPQQEPASSGRSYEEGVIAGLQQAVLARMEKNGPVTDQMRKDVMDNVYHDSLINWIKSF